MSTNNIQSPRGLQTPAFQAAGQKGDGGGNGGGGMYFGGGPYEEETDSFVHADTNNDMKDIPFFVPIFDSVKEALATWKTALAVLLYKNFEKKE